MLLWIGFSGFYNFFALLILALIVYFNNSKNKTIRSFVVFSFFTSFWSLCYFFPLVQDSKELSFLSFRLLHVFALFIATTHLQYICNFLDIYVKYRALILFGYVFNLLILPFVPTALFIRDVVPKYSFNYWADIGPIYSVWLFVWIFYVVFSTYLLAKYYLKSTGIKKQQIKYLLIGSILSFSTGSTNFFLFYNINIAPYFTIFASSYYMTNVYVIARYQYMGITSKTFNLIKKLIVLFLSLAFIFLISHLTFLYLDINIGFFSRILMILGSLGLYVLLDLLFNSKVFFQKLHVTNFEKFKTRINDFYKRDLFYANIKELQDEIYDVFENDLEISSSKIVLLDEVGADKYKNIIAHFSKKPNSYLLVDEVKMQQQQGNEKLDYYRELKKLGNLCFPLFDRNNEIMGFLVLGHKPYGNPYFDEELDLIKSAAFFISISINVLRFNQYLAQEVQLKTAELKKQSVKLKKINRKLRQYDKEKDDFLSIASHELRTPMTAIQGFSEFLLSGKFGTLDDQQKDFIGRIYKNTRGLISLVNDMLDLSKLESGRMEFKYEEVDLDKYVHDIVEEFQFRCNEKHIKATFKNPEKITSTIYTDPRKLREVFMNLLGNSFKFTPENGEINVIVTQDKDLDCFRFEVQDNGIGIPKDKLELVFEKFGQVDNSLQKSYNGTGLGLTIVRNIVKKLGGKIWAESDEGKGATFIFLHPKHEKQRCKTKNPNNRG